MSVRIRPEAGGDQKAIRAVHVAAFPTSQEADLVRRLHDDLDSIISLVAADNGQVIGHVLLSRMRVEGDGRQIRALGLAPISVLPDRQRHGVGSALVEEALRRAEQSGEEMIFLVGEPDYYRRFGFSAEAAAPFASPYAGPYFMARAFVPLPQSGKADYAAAFEELK